MWVSEKHSQNQSGSSSSLDPGRSFLLYIVNQFQPNIIFFTSYSQNCQISLQIFKPSHFAYFLCKIPMASKTSTSGSDGTSWNQIRSHFNDKIALELYFTSLQIASVLTKSSVRCSYASSFTGSTLLHRRSISQGRSVSSFYFGTSQMRRTFPPSLYVSHSTPPSTRNSTCCRPL